MKKSAIIKLFLFLTIALGFVNSFAFEGLTKPGIEEHLGSNIPLDISFTDETGNKVALKDVFSKSTVLAFVYYKCPGICTPLMMEMANVVNKVDLSPGKDYNIVTISMDDRENYQVAADKKKNFTKIITKYLSNNAWRFLTGDSASIKKAADAAGFYFQRKGDQFLHGGVVMFISSNGKICRYLYPDYSRKGGFSILPFDFKMAVLETKDGKATPTIAKVLQFCFSYDPQGKTYVFNLLKIFGAGTIFLVAIFMFFFVIRPKKVNSKQR